MITEQLEQLVRQHYPHGKNVTASLPNLSVFQRAEVSEFEANVYNPVVCVVLSGRKEILVGTEQVSLGKGDALVVSHDMPVFAKITEASKEQPYLAIILQLDLALIRGFYEQVGESMTVEDSARSIAKTSVHSPWIDPLERYLTLLSNPLEQQVLGPLTLTEIHFRLLMSPIGGMLRNLLSVSSHASKIARAIRTIRTHFREPLLIPELAKESGMSTSSFHEHFKSIIGTTPLQYQKNLRLIQAHELIRARKYPVSVASSEVGYESPTHFSRDYQRKFGCSPSVHLAS